VTLPPVTVPREGGGVAWDLQTPTLPPGSVIRTQGLFGALDDWFLSGSGELWWR